MMLCNALYSIQVQPSVQVTNDSPTTHLVEINFDDLHSDMEDIKSLIRELILSLNAPLQRTVQRDGAGLILSITDRRM
jgi:hypothetical protein